MRPLRAGIPALLLAASAASLLTACGKTGSANASAGAHLPTVDTLAEADQELHNYLQDVMVIGGRDTGTRTGSVVPEGLDESTCPAPGQATHLVVETVSGARDGYVDDVMGTLRRRGWHFAAWSDNGLGTRSTGSVQAGYHIAVMGKTPDAAVTVETPCLRGTPPTAPSDFLEFPPTEHA